MPLMEINFRFRALSRMEEDRRGILLNHLGFIQRSYRDCCPFRDKCADVLVEKVQAAQARRWCFAVHFVCDIGHVKTIMLRIP